ncbi:MAG: cystatin domain-containing protein [Verrucomicrobiota bacterium]
MKSTLVLAIAAVVVFGPIASAGRPGSYQTTSPAKQEIQAAASFAVAQESKTEGGKLELTKVVQSSQQVVAGMNYQLRMQVLRQGKEVMAEAIVFRGLDSHFELKSWRWLEQPGS